MPYRGPTLAELAKRKDPAPLRARVQTLAANPGTRGLVDTGLLQRFGLGDLARKRLLNQRLDAPAVPGGMSNREVARQANAATELQYGAPQRLVARQQQQAPGWYDAYVNALRSQADAARSQGTDSANAIKALYGTGEMAPGSQQAKIGEAQAGTAQLLGQVQANMQVALANAAQAGKLQALASIGQKQADLAKEAGAFNVAERGKIKQTELQNVATAALANVRTGTAQAAQTQKGLDFLAKTGHTPGFAAAHPGEFAADVVKRQRQLHPKGGGRSQEQIDRPYLLKYGKTYAQYQAALARGEHPKPISSRSGSGSGSSGKDPYGNTRIQRQGRTSDFRKVFRNARQLHARQPGMGVQEILAAISPDYSSVNQDVLIGAVQQATLGHVGPGTSKALQRLGVDQTYWGSKAPRRVVKRPKPGAGAPANP